MVLIAEKEHTQEIMKQVQCLLVPIRKIPDEILGCIFDECCDMNHFSNCFDVDDVESPIDRGGQLRTKPALVLSSVCSRWRRIALSLPQIWARISFTLTQDHGDSWTTDQSYYERGSPAEILTSFIERSKQHPLTINIYVMNRQVPDSDDIPPAEFTCEPLSILIDQHLRWRSFSFWSIRSEDLEILLTSLSSLHELVFPQLINFHIGRTPGTDWDFITYFYPTMLYPRTAASYFPPELLFTQLSQLQVGLVSETNMRMLFSQSTNLIALDIPDIFPAEEIYDDVLPTAHHLLETLTVCLRDFSKDDFVGPMFSFFEFPALKSLTIRRDDTCPKSGPWTFFSDFMAFVQRSSFSLTTLFIESLYLPRADWSVVHLLAHLPTLLDFTLIDTYVPLHESPITKELIESLHAYRYRNRSLRLLNGPLLPRLRSLKLTYSGDVLNDQAVVDMIKSRWTSDFNSNREVDCLRSFTMTYRRRKKVLGVYDVLDHIEKDGMRLVILWMG